MPERPSLVVFLGTQGESPVEEMVAAACRAAALDSLAAALASESYKGAVVVTNDASFEADIPGVIVDGDEGEFHFGRRLSEVIRRYGLESVVYMGGGSVPLLGAADFAGIADTLGRGVGVANNVYSSDLVAFPVSEHVLAVVAGVERDNGLARRLLENAGLTVEALPRTHATQFDIDSPSDLLVLAITGFSNPQLREYVRSLSLEAQHYRSVLRLFTDTTAQVVVAGRVGSHSWQYLERETACRVRLFAEERGMEAEARAQDGTARSLLGFYLEEAGTQRFFETLAELGDAAFLDTRVLLAHKRIEASREDRFLSDLGRWQDIRDPFLREFTRGAAEAPLPVLLGGHSLVSGGLMALNEYAWQEKETRR